MIYAAVPVKDKLHYTKGIVEQLSGQRGVASIIVLDNGSTGETADYLKSQTAADVIDMPDVGIHHMWNEAIRVALSEGAEAVALLNNDLELGPEALFHCERALKYNPDVAVVCPVYDGRVIGEVQRVTEICAGRYDGTGGLAGFAMVIRCSWLSRTGYRFPEDLKWWYGDNDLVLEVYRSGHTAAIAGRATCLHLDGGGKTGDWMSPEMQAATEADRQVFMAKWQAIKAETA